MAYDLIAYRDSFKKAHYIKLFCIFSLSFLAFHLFIKENKVNLVNSYFSKIPEGFWSNFLVSTFIFYVLSKLYSNIVRLKLLPTANSVIFFGTTLIFYHCFLRDNKLFSFHSLAGWQLPFITYADALVYGISLLSLDYKSFNILRSTPSFKSLLDESINVKAPDLLQSNTQINYLADVIRTTGGDNSFAIAVCAGWGEGKTTFLERLKLAITTGKTRNENVIFEFNPWKAASPESIVDNFFTTLAVQLKPFNRSSVKIVKDYVKRIVGAGKTVQLAAISVLVDAASKESTIESRYQELNAIIKSTGRKFIIIIDDLDRMNAHEILQVFRIIKNSGSFANVFFLVAIDHAYVVRVLGEAGLIYNAEDYLKKIFNVVVTLPQIDKQDFGVELKKLIIDESITDDEKFSIDRAIAQLRFNVASIIFSDKHPIKNEGILEGLLGNYRDMKRFANSFKMAYTLLKGKVEVVDLFLLELIKAKSFTIYSAIAQRKIMMTRKSGTDFSYGIDQSRFDPYLKLDDNINTQVALIAATNSLFELNASKSPRRISLLQNFRIYFSYQLFELIGMDEFEAALDAPWDEMAVRFTKWIKEGKGRDLNSILNTVQEYKNKEQFEQLFLGQLASSLEVARVTRMLRNAREYRELYYEGHNNDFKKFILDALHNENINRFRRAVLASELLHWEPSATSVFEIEKKQISEHISKLFVDFLRSKECYDAEVSDFLFLNRDPLASSTHVIIYKKAAKALYNYLTTTAHFLEYLRFIIKPAGSSFEKDFVFDPYVIQVFNSWKNFKKSLKKLQAEELELPEDIKRLWHIIELGTAEYLKGASKFTVTNPQDYQTVMQHLKAFDSNPDSNPFTRF